MAVNLQNLDQRFPIVDPETGQPSDYFMRLLRGQTGTLSDITGDLETDLANLIGRDINTGFGLSGGGDLSADRTLSLGDPALVDPSADRILFWDDSEGQLRWLEPGSNLSITGTVLNASGGGGGGGGTLLEYLPIDPITNSALLTAAQVIVVPAPCYVANEVTGIVLASRTVPTGHQAAPVIYEGPLWSSGSVPQPHSTSLVASGAFVTPIANTFNQIPLSAPFTPTVGRTYFVGFQFLGSTNFSLMARPFNSRQWSSSGSNNPPLATFPASPSTSLFNGPSWWTY
jgi:hypothetical protein